MTSRTAHTKTEKSFVIGVSEKSLNEREVQCDVDSPIGRVDLLDLLDEQFLPKDRVKNHGLRRISILDVMPSPELVKARIEEARKKEAEGRKKKSMDLLDFLDKRTYLPRKDADENNIPSKRISILDVMDPPPSSRDGRAKKSMDLVSFLDHKIHRTPDSRGPSGRRRISLLDVLEKQHR